MPLPRLERARSPVAKNGALRLSGGNMAQHNIQGVRDGGDWIRWADGALRALVLVVLFFGYLDWLGRSPVPALLVGALVAAGVCAWRRAHSASGDRREPANAGGLRAAKIEDVDL